MANIDDDEAIKRAVRAFYEGAGFPEYEKAKGKPVKYNKEFFDDFEKEMRKPKRGRPKKELDQSAKSFEEKDEEDL